ncbi:MAG: glutamate 5-kinase [Hormoscilla sp.]
MSETIVVKIGTSSITDPQRGSLALSTIATLVEVLTDLRQRENRVILVTSGAIGVGCAQLGLTTRPRTIAQKQAIAALGQGRLMRVYDDWFGQLQQPIAQVLLTRGDLDDRERYLNAYNTFGELLDLGVIPIVNENDTVATDELRFGDNDRLSALVASLVEASWLFILTDVDRLYSADPRLVPDAEPITLVEDLDQLAEVETQTKGSQWGTGGMKTKITAARMATMAGVRTVITQGRNPRNIAKILQGVPLGTQFAPHPEPISARKRWIAHGLITAGTLYLDNGAVAAICERGKSLLPAGITQVSGEFNSLNAVLLCDAEGKEIARGIVNYSSSELEQIKGRKSDEITTILGYMDAETVVHRDNLVLI